MSALTTGPALMHFPLARRYAMAGYRIRRAVWQDIPTIVSSISGSGDSSSLTISGAKKLAWLSYAGGLYYVTTWQTYKSGTSIFHLMRTITRVVSKDDCTYEDLMAEDWTVLPLGCNVKDQACACAGAKVLRGLPGYPQPARDLEPAFDLAAPNARLGLFGCALPPADPWDTVDGNCSCANTGSDGGGTGNNSGNNPPNPDTNSGSKATGGGGGGGGGGSSGGGAPPNNPGGGGGGGGNGERQREPKPPSTSSVTVTIHRARSQCYNRGEYTADGKGGVTVGNSFSGDFSLSATEDGTLWWYKIKFRGSIIASGLCKPGDVIGWGPQDVQAAPGTPVTCVVDCHKPGSHPDDASGGKDTAFPDWCDPTLRPPRPRPRPPARPPRPPRRPPPRRRPRIVDPPVRSGGDNYVPPT